MLRRLLALSDLHVAFPENRKIIEELRPGSAGEQGVARAARDPALPVIFVTHYPLVREPTRVLRYPQFAQWCGTTRTYDWHVRFNPAAVVYGHLHIPRVTWYVGVRFEEVSIGYPREWQRRGVRPGVPRQILPVAEGEPR